MVEIVYDLWPSWNFAIVDIINRKRNPMTDVKKNIEWYNIA